jgi:hypothetical protein
MEKTSTYRRFSFFAQLAAILTPITMFFDAAIIFRGRINLSVYTAATFFLILNMGLLLLIAFSIRYFLAYCKNRKLNMTGDQQTKARSTKKKRILSYLPVTVVVSVFSALAALQFSSLPRYDGGLY